MSATTEITPVRAEPQTLDDMQRFAMVAVKSGHYKDLKDIASAVIRIQMGREMGIGAAASLKSIQVISGTPTFSAAFIGAQIKRSRPRYNYFPKTITAKECILSFWEEGKEVGTWSFTIEEAKLAGLASKEVWIKYPKSMLFSRCLTAGARIYCPDITVFPIYTSEELGGEPVADDLLEEEKTQKTFTAASGVSVEDRYKLLSLCAERGIAWGKVQKNMGIVSLDSISAEQYSAALKFVTVPKGD